MANTPHNIQVTIDPALSMVWRIQGDLQTVILGEHPSDLSDEAKSAYIREQGFALIAELFEAMNAVNWKSWASTKGIHNPDEYRSELCADLFRFFINLCLAGGITSSDLIKSYMDKVETVASRVGNYDGRTGKCPACHRDYNDKGVTCAAASPGTYAWCEVYGDVDAVGVGVAIDPERHVHDVTKFKQERMGTWTTPEPDWPLGHPYQEQEGFSLCSYVTRSGTALYDVDRCGLAENVHTIPEDK